MKKVELRKLAKRWLEDYSVPYPDVGSFEELNQYLHERCSALLKDNPKWEAETKALRPLLASPFGVLDTRRPR